MLIRHRMFPSQGKPMTCLTRFACVSLIADSFRSRTVGLQTALVRACLFQVHLNLGSQEAVVLIFTPSSRSQKTSDKNPANSAVSLNSQTPLKCQVTWLPSRPWVECLRQFHVRAAFLLLGIVEAIVFCRTCFEQWSAAGPGH